MASVVEICNLALAKIGQGTINTLSEASPQAEACSLVYEPTRDALLRQYPWNFATKSAFLGQVSVTIPEADVWLYIYQYPTNALHVRKVFNKGNIAPEIPNDYEIISTGNSKYVCCNIDQAIARYTLRVTDTTVFDPLFVQALACKIATELAMQKGDTNRIKVTMSSFNEAHQAAMLAGAIEGAEQRPQSQKSKSARSYINARR
ncbi:MAG: hypothetical protein H6Q73_198 [Firmicutes bacterium]|nr:hypothetical protein [Bacillota bacterium]